MAGVSLVTWIRQALLDPDKDGPCTALALKHETGSGAEKPIHAIQITAANPRDPEDIAQLFRHKAEMHCQELDGVQRCVVLAFYKGRSAEEARFAFRVKGYTAMDGNVTEGPDAKGAVSQTMRHLEANASLVHRQLSTLVESANDQMRIMARMNKELMEENAQAVSIVKELVLEEKERVHQMRLEELRLQQSAADREAILRYLPALANTITGKEVFPQATADSELLRLAAKHITPEAAQKIAEVLPPALVGPLMSRMAEYQKEATEHKKLEQHAASLVTDEFEDEDGANGS